jgi:hypothetical protein
MRRVLRWGGGALIVSALAIQFARPARTNPSSDLGATLAAHLEIAPAAAVVLDRACRDCHSNETRWPWYSGVAPVSWFVVDHVNHGRSHFNYSEWAQYSRDDARRLLENTCAFARRRTMPLRSYAWVHRGARLTDEEIAALCSWTSGALRHPDLLGQGFVP